LEKVDGRRLVYKFGKNAFGWQKPQVKSETCKQDNCSPPVRRFPFEDGITRRKRKEKKLPVKRTRKVKPPPPAPQLPPQHSFIKIEDIENAIKNKQNVIHKVIVEQIPLSSLQQDEQPTWFILFLFYCSRGSGFISLGYVILTKKIVPSLGNVVNLLEFIHHKDFFSSSYFIVETVSKVMTFLLSCSCTKTLKNLGKDRCFRYEIQKNRTKYDTPTL